MRNIYRLLEILSEDEHISDIIEKIIEKYKVNSFSINSSMYILPDGTLLDLGTSGNGHSDLAKFLADEEIEKNYEEGKASNFLYSLGWIRVNNRYKFITIPKVKLTEAQYVRLLELFDIFKKDYQVTTLDGQYQIYLDRTSDEVVKLIRRYYLSGRLYEKLKY